MYVCVRTEEGVRDGLELELQAVVCELPEVGMGTECTQSS